MPLTREFKETYGELMQDAETRHELLKNAVDLILANDLVIGRALLRDYINASIGFQSLADAMGKSPKNLMQSFSASGNPTAQTLFSVIEVLRDYEGIEIEARIIEAA